MKDHERFSKLKFPIHKLKDGQSVLDAFPILNTYKAFQMYKGASKDEIIKYVIYLYDKESELIEEYPDLRNRKEAAAELAGFHKMTKARDGKPHWPEPITFAINSRFDHDQGAGIFKMVLSYLQMQNTPAWMELCVLEQEHIEAIEIRFQKIEADKSKDVIEAAKKKRELRDSCGDILDKIKTYRDQLFGDNEDVSEHTTHLRLTKPELIDRMLKRV